MDNSQREYIKRRNNPTAQYYYYERNNFYLFHYIRVNVDIIMLKLKLLKMYEILDRFFFIDR